MISYISMTVGAFMTSPYNAQSHVCHKLSMSMRLQEDTSDYKCVLDLEEEFVAEKRDLVLFWATKVPVRFCIANIPGTLR